MLILFSDIFRKIKWRAPMLAAAAFIVFCSNAGVAAEAETKQLSPEALQASGDSEKPNTGQNGKTEGGVKSSSKLEFSDMAETLAAAMDWDKIPTTTAAEYAAAKKAADAGNPAAQFAVGAANLLGAG